MMLLGRLDDEVEEEAAEPVEGVSKLASGDMIGVQSTGAARAAAESEKEAREGGEEGEPPFRRPSERDRRARPGCSIESRPTRANCATRQKRWHRVSGETRAGRRAVSGRRQRGRASRGGRGSRRWQ